MADSSERHDEKKTGEPLSAFMDGSAAAAKRTQPSPRIPSAADQVDAARGKEFQRREMIRHLLLEQARKNYPHLLDSAQTSYSTYLQGLQQRVDHDLQAENNRFHSRAVILDPTKFDAGMAIGLNSAASVNAQLQAQGVNRDPDVVDVAGDKMSSPFTTKFGSHTYTQDPTTLMNVSDPGREACVIIPASDHAVPDEFNIPGLSFQDQIKLFNNHESWHCRDDRYSLRGINVEDVKNANIADPRSIANNPTACKVIAISYQKEAFADAGGIGTMLREGYDLSLLDRVADWRQERPADLVHITTPVLRGMKQEIEQMGGIAKFRAMSDEQARQFYYKVVDKYGVTGPAVQSAVKFALAGPVQSFGQEVGALFDRDTSKGIDFYRYFSANPQPLQSAPLTPQQAIGLDHYDPQAQLEERAFDRTGKITPESMIKAYGELQDELRSRMQAHPGDQLYPQEMTKLQREFTHNVKTMDYVEANQRFGVTIENVEPVLAAFSDKPAQKAPPRTLKPAVKP